MGGWVVGGYNIEPPPVNDAVIAAVVYVVGIQDSIYPLSRQKQKT